MATAIDGKIIVNKLANKILIPKIQKIRKNNFLKALGIIVTSDAPEIQTYINAKQKFFNKYNIPFVVTRVKPKKDEIIRWINKFNDNKQIGGILLQLPLHKNIEKYQNLFLNLINTKKDVEGLNNCNLGNLIQGLNIPFSPAVCGMINALDYYKINWKNKHWGILGAGTIVGKPLVAFLTGQKVSFTIIDQNNKDYSSLLKVDIVVTATGSNTRSIILKILDNTQKHNLILLDAGTYYKNGLIHSDLNLSFNPNDINMTTGLESIISKKVKLYTPKLHSLGPLTVYCLANNYIDIISN